MNTFIKAVFLLLAVSAKAENIWGPSDSSDLNAAALEEDRRANDDLFDNDDFTNNGSRNQRPGSSYCTYSPDYDCYRRGWPSCCQVNGGRDCPRAQPQCDVDNRRPGSSYCTYSPDYDCYRNGWPSCCGMNGGRDCPRDQPQCEIRPPNPRPTPSRRRRPTPRPSRRPTRRPSRQPTRRPTNRRPTNTCVNDDRPRPVRDGQRFRFNLVDANAQCVDTNDRLYEWGQFNSCENFSKCADMCVNDVSSSLAFDGNFRGFDYDCDQQVCRCLYDSGTLNSRNSGRFNRVNRNEPGRGSISGTTRKTYTYCGKLVGAELFLEDAVAEA